MSIDNNENRVIAPAGRAAPRRGCRRGCLMVGLGLAALVVGLGGLKFGCSRVGQWKLARQEKKEHQEQVKKFDKVIDKLDKQAKAEKKKYDLDRTVRVMHGIDLAMREKQSFEELLAHVMGADVTGVAPEVLKARKQIFTILKKQYATQRELGARESLWRYTSEFFVTALSLFDVKISPTNFSFGGDKQQAKGVLKGMKDKYSERDKLRDTLARTEDELFGVVYDYAATYYKYVAEWDRLCALRDRAYLAVANNNWDAAIESSRQAMALAPSEKEAHLLLALALSERGGELDRGEAISVLADYAKEHPEASAPALLLLGVAQGQQGDKQAATLSLQQAAAYYPRQAESLADMLDPYRMRNFLRRSREGNFIRQQYKSTMLGAGYFSPDLQMAKGLFDANEIAAGSAKVFDHFFRRRLQREWEFILSDIQFCYDFLGTDFHRIYPESSYLDLAAKPGRGGKLAVAVNNRSDRTLHNASLILCLHFTDMFPGDYAALQVGETLPALLANDQTSFGDVTINEELYGVSKSVDDIVAHRAILVSQEAVVWVDTQVYRIAEAREFRESRQRGEAQEELQLGWFEALQSDPTALAKGLLKDARATPEAKLGKDNLHLRLPKELAILRPIFRLMIGERTLEPTENIIEDDFIKLTFSKVAEFGKGDVGELLLIVNSPYADLALSWVKDGEKGFRLSEIKRK